MLAIRRRTSQGCHRCWVAWQRQTLLTIPSKAPQRCCAGEGGASSSKPGFRAQPPKEILNQPIGDSAKVAFGKYEGLTYKEIFESQPGYCKWLIQSTLKSEPGPFNIASLKLAVYVLNRRDSELAAKAPSPPSVSKTMAALPPPQLQARAPSCPSAPETRATPATPQLQDVSGAPGCLVGQEGQPLTFVLSGRAFGGQLTKSTVRALLEFFGGVVRTAVSGKTDFLVVGEEKASDWSRSGVATRQPGSSTLKEQKAREHRIETLRFEELLELIRKRSEGASQEEPSLFSLNLATRSEA